MILRLLTELDALLDTRAGLMDLLSPEHAVKLISNPAYYERDTDDFEALCGFPNDVYRHAWKNRTSEVLKHSLNTPAVDLVHYGLVEAERRSVNDPTISYVAVDINEYPYKLTEAERRAFAQALVRVLGVKSVIRMIYAPPAAITPEKIRDENGEPYSGMILYNHVAWFQAHWERLLQVSIPRVTLVAPKLWPEKPLDDYDLTVEGMGRVDPWHQATAPLLQHIGLEYVEVRHYCIAHPAVPA